MAKAYDNNMRGVLFKNDEKQDEKDRDYQGTITIGGVEYWLSAWINTSDKGTKYMSLSVKPKEQRQAQGRPQQQQPKRANSDDIPF